MFCVVVNVLRHVEAHSCSKHVEDSYEHIIEEIVRQVGYLPELRERCFKLQTEFRLNLYL